MAKRKAYLSREKVLSKDEYEEYRRLKSAMKKEEYKREISEMKRSSSQGRVGKVLSKTFGSLGSRQGVARSLYGQARKTGKVGRPRGTVKYTDPRTGQPIGVYEYRKILTARLRAEREKGKMRLSPDEERAIRRVKVRNYNQSLNPERKTIPDTYGGVDIDSITDEINNASNLVG